MQGKGHHGCGVCPTIPPSPSPFTFSLSMTELRIPVGSMDLMDVDPTAEKITDVVISNLGGTGTYQEVVNMVPGENMVCPEPDDTCVQKVRTE